MTWASHKLLVTWQQVCSCLLYMLHSRRFHPVVLTDDSLVSCGNRKKQVSLSLWFYHCLESPFAKMFFNLAFRTSTSFQDIQRPAWNLNITFFFGKQTHHLSKNLSKPTMFRVPIFTQGVVFFGAASSLQLDTVANDESLLKTQACEMYPSWLAAICWLFHL